MKAAEKSTGTDWYLLKNGPISECLGKEEKLFIYLFILFFNLDSHHSSNMNQIN